jgi:hypothetical protein
MSTPITQHVRALSSSHIPDPGRDFWTAFRGLVRAEWRRQRLRTCPPSFLGYHGFSSWSDAWEDLVTDCYIAAILDPADELRACLAQATADGSIDALVRLHIRWFLSHRRSASDPVGTAVYRRLGRCLRRLPETDELAAGELGSPPPIPPDHRLLRPQPGNRLGFLPARVGAAGRGVTGVEARDRQGRLSPA